MNGTSQTAGTQRTLVFVWGGIGNMVMALPMIAALKRSERISALGVIAQKSPMLELVDAAAFSLALSLDDVRYRGLAGMRRLIRELRAMHPAIAIGSVAYPRRYGLLALASGAGHRICEDTRHHWSCNESVKTSRKHIVHRNLELLGPLGIAGTEPDYSLIHRGDPSTALRSVGLEESPGIIGIFPGAGHSQRMWSLEKFTALTRKLAERFQVVVFADPDDPSIANDLMTAVGNRVKIFTGPLRQKLGMLAACRLFISVNTGLVHCAAALGVPTLELEGPTDPAIYRPLGANVTVVRGIAPCSPCYRSGNRYGCGQRDPQCMSDITVERVWSEAERMLATRP